MFGIFKRNRENKRKCEKHKWRILDFASAPDASEKLDNGMMLVPLFSFWKCTSCNAFKIGLGNRSDVGDVYIQGNLLDLKDCEYGPSIVKKYLEHLIPNIFWNKPSPVNGDEIRGSRRSVLHTVKELEQSKAECAILRHVLESVLEVFGDEEDQPAQEMLADIKNILDCHQNGKDFLNRLDNLENELKQTKEQIEVPPPRGWGFSAPFL